MAIFLSLLPGPHANWLCSASTANAPVPFPYLDYPPVPLAVALIGLLVTNNAEAISRARGAPLVASRVDPSALRQVYVFGEEAATTHSW
jgi:hypothetical protein